MLGPSTGVWSAASSSPPDHRVVGSGFPRLRLKDANPPCFSHGTLGASGDLDFRMQLYHWHQLL
jgi:hypothetical protein